MADNSHEISRLVFFEKIKKKKKKKKLKMSSAAVVIGALMVKGNRNDLSKLFCLPLENGSNLTG